VVRACRQDESAIQDARLAGRATGHQHWRAFQSLLCLKGPPNGDLRVNVLGNSSFSCGCDSEAAHRRDHATSAKHSTTAHLIFRMTHPRPPNEKSDPVQIRFFRTRAAMQFANSLPHLLQNFCRLPRAEDVARLTRVNDVRAKCRICVNDGNRESVMGVHRYGLRAEAIDCKCIFRIFSGMIGSSAERYADAVLPTLS
jgi:hypothetical protein